MRDVENILLTRFFKFQYGTTSVFQKNTALFCAIIKNYFAFCIPRSSKESGLKILKLS